MNCNEFKNEMLHWTGYTNNTLPEEFRKHLATCHSCLQEYEEMEEAIAWLTPRAEMKAPLLLKEKIIKNLSNKEVTMKQSETKVVRMSPKIKRIIAIAATILLFFIMLPFFGKKTSADVNAANVIFNKAVSAIDGISTMIMKFNARTEANDNFAMIGKQYEMVPHTLIKTFNPEKWRLDKPGRTALMDGASSYLWMPEVELATKFSKNALGLIDWYQILLYPANILRKEEYMAKEKGVKLISKEKGDEIFVSITSGADGNFVNDYAKNTSIIESDNRREYIFDKKTNLLKSLKIYLLEKEKETLIFETTDITYNKPVEENAYAIFLPSGVKWQEYKLPEKNEELSNSSAKQITEMVLNDLIKEDFETHKDVWGNLLSRKMIKMISKDFAGGEILYIGEPFKSGRYPGVHVPYKVKFKSGHIKELSLALRNDNPSKVWQVDGGI